jgi:2-octaprenyl-6-methoxyphenol hydroxylase
MTAKMRRNSVKKRVNRNDIMIVGGGPAGLALASCLGTAGFSVVCIERRAPRRARTIAKLDGRTTALSYGSAQILKNGGVWPHLQKAACPILDIRIIDQNSPAFLDFHHREIGRNPFGWIVENHIFHQALLARIRELKSVQRIEGAVERLETNDDGARVILTDGRVLTTSLVVGADGRHSICRTQAAIPIYGWTYDQTSIVCAIAHEKPHHNVAVEHFLPGGPLAVLPMTKQRSSIVWTEKNAAAEALMKMSDADFAAALGEKVKDWLGAIRLAGARVAHPLSLQHARRYIDRRLVLIGDAAHGIHPIAGQGFNLGMGDIGVLLDELSRARSLGLDWGDAIVLKRYEKRRKSANGNMVFMTDILDRLFSNAIPSVEAARRFGLGAVQRLPPLKRFFMRTAMGIENQRSEDKNKNL